MPSRRFTIHLASRLRSRPAIESSCPRLRTDTAFFGAIAAGLWPVMAPVSIHDGNMRVDAIDDVTWSTISAVLTGNTYGLPDRVTSRAASPMASAAACVSA